MELLLMLVVVVVFIASVVRSLARLLESWSDEEREDNEYGKSTMARCLSPPFVYLFCHPSLYLTHFCNLFNNSQGTAMTDLELEI